MLGRQGKTGARARWALPGLLAIAAATLLALPGAAAAQQKNECVPGETSGAKKKFTCTVGPVAVNGYEVKQDVIGLPAHPGIDGFITNMSTNVVDEDGSEVPIQRLMLHHIVFTKLFSQDPTCSDGFLDFGNRPNSFGGLRVERFYAAGEERAKMALPAGYGYPIKANDRWGLLYMFMNHLPNRDQAYIRYDITVDTDPSLTPVKPYWLDVKNCRADPIYNVPGTKGPGSKHRRQWDLTMPESGRIVGGGGHVHGGAYKLTLTKPNCGGQRIGESIPTWGKRNHEFYRVRPVLHEPGPIAMSGFQSRTGIPVAKGETIRLNSIYDNSLPHVRAMGIMVIYVDHSKQVEEPCAELPSDTSSLLENVPGREGPIPYRIPLTGLNKGGEAVTIRKPRGKLRRLQSGGTVEVVDNDFAVRNVRVKRNARLRWRFTGRDLHNVTLANGPVGIGSLNLDGDRTFSKRLRRKGTYRLFCGLHPVQMHQRVIVEGKRSKRKRR